MSTRTIDEGYVFDPQAASPGNGSVWVKSTSPSTIQFTDDAGTDHELSGGGAPAGSGTGGAITLQDAYDAGQTISMGTNAFRLEHSTLSTEFAINRYDIGLTAYRDLTIFASDETAGPTCGFELSNHKAKVAYGSLQRKFATVASAGDVVEWYSADIFRVAANFTVHCDTAGTACYDGGEMFVYNQAAGNIIITVTGTGYGWYGGGTTYSLAAGKVLHAMCFDDKLWHIVSVN